MRERKDDSKKVNLPVVEAIKSTTLHYNGPVKLQRDSKEDDTASGLFSLSPDNLC